MPYRTILRGRGEWIDAGRVTTTVVHHPRVAWDVARTVVAMAMADDERYSWFVGQVEQCLGASARLELGQTRHRLAHTVRPDAHPVELGRWRVRIEDALSNDPALAEALSRLLTA
jgi:hypothetical protein